MAKSPPLNGGLRTSLALVAALGFLLYPQGGQAHPRLQSARVLRVIDGDSFVVRIEIWKDLFVTPQIRLLAVDAPEFPPRARCKKEAALAHKAKKRLQSLLGKSVRLRSLRHGKDRYGRVLAEALVARPHDKAAVALRGRSIGKILLQEGLAKAYDGGKKPNWCGRTKRKS